MESSPWLVIVILIILATSGLFLFKSPNHFAPTGVTKTTVLMKPDVFEPKTLTIKKGTTVEFKNLDNQARWPASNIHPTHTIYPEFDPKEPVGVDKSWSLIFDKAGSWKYHDHLTPSIRGTIVVTE